MPRVLLIDPVRPDPTTVAEAASVLRSGGIVGLPTETVYGLGGLALVEAALGRIFAAKGRPATHPLIAHVLDAAQAEALSSDWPRLAAALAEAFWPGPLTIVVPKAGHVPSALTGGSPMVAVRVPSHPVMRAVLAAAEGPIAAPSANAYQSLSPTLASHVVRSLGDKVDLILDAGPCERGIESTVVAVSSDRVTVLRLGALSLADMRVVVPAVDGNAPGEGERVTPRVVPEGHSRPSPGLDRKHYSPSVPLRLVVREKAIPEEGVGVLRFGGEAQPGVWVLAREPGCAMHGLFAALHDLEASGVLEIVVEEPPPGEAWDAVRDRLTRAAR